jgi:phosphoserine phosphatase RsbU/P
MANLDSEHLQCMEIWGGSTSVDRAVEMAGLDAWVYSKPYDPAKGSARSSPDAAVAGGDVYYASSCATGRIHRLLLADVAGHGNAVADIAEQLRALMRRYVNHIDQKQFVRSMNQQFVRDSADGCFATALVTTFFSPNRMLSVCNAGHPRPMIYRPARQSWAILEQLEESDKRPRNIPLGILDLADYEQFDTRLEIGDLVVCYTDALIESKGIEGRRRRISGGGRVAAGHQRAAHDRAAGVYCIAIKRNRFDASGKSGCG